MHLLKSGRFFGSLVSLVLLLTIPSGAKAAIESALKSATDTTVPMINLRQFTVGSTWTWTYYTQGDKNKIYSTEQYRVVALTGTFVTIEIWTKYAGKTDFTPSAKLVADLETCQRAYAGPYKTAFMIDMYPYQKGQWSDESYSITAVAFEEKFNCNPRVYTAPAEMFKTRFETVVTPWGAAELFQQWPRVSTSQLQAFYFLSEPGLQGVADEKAFNPNSPEFYLMRLTDWSGAHESAKL